MKVSLIISTYNWPEALDLVLKSVMAQSQLPDEILIADDGSTENTRKLIGEWKKKSPVPLLHIWHEDRGFRLSAIRNKAIAAARYEYIIQIDGDVILHKNFIADHKNLAERNCFLTGSRTLLSPELTEGIMKSGSIRISPLAKGIKNRFNSLYLPAFNRFARPENAPMEKMTTRIRGCNMSFWREDLIAINGYDEDFVGWGREDSDIVIRLIKKGCCRKKIKLAAIQYHIYHPENSKANLEENHRLMEQAIAAPGFRTKKGIEK